MDTSASLPGSELNLGTTFTLNNGVKIPRLGLGVWQAEDGEVVERATQFALSQGYRLIDTAAIYRNESGVGTAIINSGIAREQIFVTSKLWNDDIRKGDEQAAFNESLQKLKLDFLDLYLVHWPIVGKLESSWHALEKICDSKKARAVGVSNYHVAHLEQIAKCSKLVPAVNQIECHPFLQQKEIRQYCKEHGIAVQAWSPLMQGNFKDISLLEKISQKHKKSAPQILLRWNLQSNILTIPKSVHEARILENSKIFDFSLDEEDMLEIEKLDCGKRFGPNPESFNF